MWLTRFTLGSRLSLTKVLKFNDRYAELAGPELPSTLEYDLSRLGEHIAMCIELEDEFLEVILPAD